MDLQALGLELLSVREQSRGRPVVDQEAFARRQEILATFAPLARVYRLNGEARGAATLDWMIGSGMEPVKSFLGPHVRSVVPEYQIDRWRVDRAAFHEGGRASLIEVKDGGSPRDAVAGIGQVLFYKAALERTSSFAPIVPALAVLAEHDVDLARACSLAGVEYLPLGDVKWMRTLSEFVALTVCG